MSMGILQKFVAFAEKLEGKDKVEAERIMKHIMETLSHDYTLTPEQEAEDLRRALDPNPQYASQAEIEAICGRKMPS